MMHLHKDINVTSKYGTGCTLEFSLLFIMLLPFELNCILAVSCKATENAINLMSQRQFHYN